MVRFVFVNKKILLCFMLIFILKLTMNLLPLNAASIEIEKITPTSVESKRIIPHFDLEYLGAFTVPDDPDFVRGPGGGTFNPDGDPNNVDGDPYTGSLIIMASSDKRTVAEISIPNPQIRTDGNWRALPQASILQPPTDITEGYTFSVNGQDPNNPPKRTKLTDWAPSDVEIIGPEQGVAEKQLLWVLTRKYTQTRKVLTIGSCSLNFSKGVNAKGHWRLNFPTPAPYSQYLFKIPKKWADLYTGGKTIAIGQNRYSIQGSSGVTIYAIKPWPTGTPPENGAVLDAVPMLNYFSRDNKTQVMDYYLKPNTPGDGTWITINNKNAIVFYGTYAERDKSRHKRYKYIPQWKYEVEATPDEHGEAKGFVGSPYQNALYFYDPNDILRGMRGEIRMNQVQPYAAYSIERFVYSELNKSNWIHGMISYDSKGHILYVEEKLKGYDGFNPRSIIHMFKVKDIGTNIDETPPTDPTNLKIDSIDETRIKISWTPGKDSVTPTWHVVLRNDVAISFVRPGQASYVDDKIKEWRDLGTQYFRYQVMALDEYYNYSGRSNTAEYNFDVDNFKDITYYHNCDDFGPAQKSVGDPNVYPEEHASVYRNHGPGYGLGTWYRPPFGTTATDIGIRVPIKGNINLDEGRLGFFVVPYSAKNTVVKPGFILSTIGDSGPDELSLEIVDGQTIKVGYKGNIKNITVDYGPNNRLRYHLNFVEFKFKDDACVVYWNGIERGVVEAGTKEPATATYLMFLKHGDQIAAKKATVDQIIFSKDPDRNLYSLRSETGFGK